MKLKLLVIIVLFSNSLFLLAQYDTRFWFAAPAIVPYYTTQLNQPIYLRLEAKDKNAVVKISLPADNGFTPIIVNVSKNSLASVNLTPYLDDLECKPSNTTLNKGILIESTTPIFAFYEIVSSPGDPETYSLKGRYGLGKSFVIPGQNVFSNHNAYKPTPFDRFYIVASEDNTKITIVPSNDILGHKSNLAFNIKLNRGQVYTAEATSQAAIFHLRGSLVTADKPVAITICDDLISYQYCQNQSGDQILPIESFGTEFAFVKGDLNNGDFIIITGSEDSTKLFINDDTVSINVNKYEFKQIIVIADLMYIRSDKPINIMHYTGVKCEVGVSTLIPITCGVGIYNFNFSFVQTNFNYNDAAFLITVPKGHENDFLLDNAKFNISFSPFKGKPDLMGGKAYMNGQPYDKPFCLKNTTSAFRLGFIQGKEAGGAYSFFSDFVSSDGVDVNLKNNSPVCSGDTLYLFASSMDSVHYEWSGPNGFISQEQNPVIPNATPNMTGEYVVTVTSSCNNGSAKTMVLVNTPPEPKILGLKEICEGDSSILGLEKKYKQLIWSTGEKTNNITIRKSGQYWVEVTDTSGCKARDTIDFICYPNPEFKIKGNTTFCKGDSSVLSVLPFDSNFTYIWSTGELTSSIVVLKSGKYKLIVTNQYGCKDSLEMDVVELQDINPKISGKTILCKGSINELSAEPIGSEYNYLWSTNETSQKISIDKPGRYWVKVSFNDNCSDTAFFDVTEIQKPEFSINGSSFICPYDTVQLSPNKDFISYVWSTGAITKAISVFNPGIYSVKVIDSNGCTGLASFEVKIHHINLTGIVDLDFGSQHTGGSYLQNITLKNESNSSIVINNISIKNLSSIFKITSNQPLPKTLNVDSTLQLMITFNPDTLMPYIDSLIIEVEKPCRKLYYSELRGTTFAEIFVNMPDTTAIIGTPNFCMPLNIRKTEKILVDEILNYTVEIRYNCSALKPYNIEGIIVSKDRVINFAADTLNLYDDFITIDSICGMVFLSETNRTPFRIVSFELNNPLIHVIKQDGSLTVKGVCQQDIARIQLINPPDFTIKNNIVSDELEISTMNTTKGDILRIYSIFGKNVGNYVCSDVMTICVNDFSSGVYFIRLGVKFIKFIKV